MTRIRSAPWLLLTIALAVLTGACATVDRTVATDADDTASAASPATTPTGSTSPVQTP